MTRLVDELKNELNKLFWQICDVLYIERMVIFLNNLLTKKGRGLGNWKK